MIDLTIDVCILMSGSGIGNPLCASSCHSFMKNTLEKQTLFLALDDRGRIEQQYRTKLKEGTFGYHWFYEMNNKNKTVIISWQNIDRGTRTALKEAHFDPEDFKYVETAAATDCKTITSHDPDYSSKVCKILKKRLDVKVKDSQQCLKCFF